MGYVDLEVFLTKEIGIIPVTFHVMQGLEHAVILGISLGGYDSNIGSQA